MDDRLSQALLATTDNEQLKMLAILNEVTVTVDNRDDVQRMIGLVVTENHLRLLALSHTWLSPNSSSPTSIDCQRSQPMSNLVDVEMLSDRVMRINYLDENQDTCELWTCTFETDDGAKSTLDAIEHSWSKLFGVPLRHTK